MSKPETFINLAAEAVGQDVYGRLSVLPRRPEKRRKWKKVWRISKRARQRGKVRKVSMGYESY